MSNEKVINRKKHKIINIIKSIVNFDKNNAEVTELLFIISITYPLVNIFLY